MYNSIFDKSAKRRLDDVLRHEGASMAQLKEKTGMSEEQILRGTAVGCHSVVQTISKVLGKAMIQGYLLEPGRYYYDKNGEIRPVYLK